MKIFGYELSVKKAQMLSSVESRSGGWQTIFDSTMGAWQQHTAVDTAQVMTYHAIFSCITLISNDIGKLWPKLMKENDGISEEIDDPDYSKLLRKPNRYQNYIQFKENWIQSKLSRGNTYVLKAKNNRGLVVALYILDPDRVLPLVSEEGDVFYQLSHDNLAGLTEQVIVPASEIIHDRINCLYHPLVGLSPICAAGLAATQGLAMQNNSSKLFAQMSKPGGILIAPGPISPESAAILKTRWDENFSGDNYGKTAVLGDGMKYESLAVTADESQFIDQLKWTAEVVCSVFHVPAWKIGLAPPPNQSPEVANIIYYTDCLQSPIEQMEESLNEGLGLIELSKNYSIELDLDGLMRMDKASLIKAAAEEVAGSIATPNEARRTQNKKPLPGGDTIYMQQQNFSLEALAKRDAQPDPFGTSQPAPVAEPKPEPEEDVTDKFLAAMYTKTPESYSHAA